MSSSIFTVPYVCLYNGARGMCSYTTQIPSVSTQALQTEPKRLSVVRQLSAQVFILYFGHGANWVSTYEKLQSLQHVCCSSKLFLIVFRGNHCDMSVGIVNITQRKYDKDILYLLHRKPLKTPLREASYIYATYSADGKLLFFFWGE